MLGAKIPGHCHKIADANLDCVFVENALVFAVVKKLTHTNPLLPPFFLTV